MDEKYLQAMSNTTQLIEANLSVIKELKELVSEYAEKAKAYDMLDAKEQCLSMSQAGSKIKEVLGLKKMSSQMLIKLLCDWGDMRKIHSGYQAYEKNVEAGHYKNVSKSTDAGYIVHAVKVSAPKGLSYIVKKMQKQKEKLSGLIEYK